MLKAYITDIHGVGLVLFERSRRAKHLNISIRPFKGVRVAVPYRMSFRKAEKIVYSKTDWIQKHLARFKHVAQEQEPILNNSARINKTAARKKLIARLSELAEEYGFTYNRVFIRNQQTRWGSCSSRNNISLNMKLVRLPDMLFDYVILHELVHTRVKNHSKNFWEELDRVVFLNSHRQRPGEVRQPYPSGYAKKMSSRLKKFGLRFL